MTTCIRTVLERTRECLPPFCAAAAAAAPVMPSPPCIAKSVFRNESVNHRQPRHTAAPASLVVSSPYSPSHTSQKGALHTLQARAQLAQRLLRQRQRRCHPVVLHCTEDAAAQRSQKRESQAGQAERWAAQEEAPPAPLPSTWQGGQRAAVRQEPQRRSGSPPAAASASR